MPRCAPALSKIAAMMRSKDVFTTLCRDKLASLWSLTRLRERRRMLPLSGLITLPEPPPAVTKFGQPHQKTRAIGKMEHRKTEGKRRCQPPLTSEGKRHRNEQHSQQVTATHQQHHPSA